MSRRTLILSILPWVALCPASAQSPSPTPSQQGIDPNLELRNWKKQTLLGQQQLLGHTPDQAKGFQAAGLQIPAEGCRFSVHVPKGRFQLGGIEASPLQMNPDGTCQQDYFIGEPFGAPDPASLQVSAPSNQSSHFSRGSKHLNAIEVTPLMTCQPCVRSESKGYTQVWYTDPVNITVNLVQSILNWGWNNCCVVSEAATAHLSWYSPSGWQPPNPDYSRSGYSCYAGAYAEKIDDFFNGTFCPAITGNPNNTTAIDYNQVEFDGYNNGDGQGIWSVVPVGGCINLLTFHWVVNSTCLYGAC